MLENNSLPLDELVSKFLGSPEIKKLDDSWYYELKKAREDNNDIILSVTPYKEDKTCGLSKRIQAQTESIDVNSLVDFLQSDNVALAFNFKFGESSRFFIPNPESYQNSDIWFLGDIHGDSLVLQIILPYIEAYSPDGIIVFMGDLFDRHSDSLNVLKIVLDLIRRKPSQVLWLAGNHDIGLTYDEEKGFSSSVKPACFSDQLNQKPELKFFGKCLIDFIHKLPFALLLEEGIFVSHAGIPSSEFESDVWENIKNLEDLCSTKMEHAFESNRLVVSRSKSYEEFGWNELQDFCKKIRELKKINIYQFLRGHDHCGPLRHEKADFNPDWKKESHQDISVLTLTSMFLVDENEKNLQIFRKEGCTQSAPTVFHFNTANKNEVLSFKLPDNMASEYYSQLENMDTTRSFNKKTI